MLTTLVLTRHDTALTNDGRVSDPVQNSLLRQSIVQGMRVAITVQNKIHMEVLELFDGGFLDSLLEALGKVFFDAD